MVLISKCIENVSFCISSINHVYATSYIIYIISSNLNILVNNSIAVPNIFQHTSSEKRCSKKMDTMHFIILLILFSKVLKHASIHLFSRTCHAFHRVILFWIFFLYSGWLNPLLLLNPLLSSYKKQMVYKMHFFELENKIKIIIRLKPFSRKHF